MEIRQLQYFVVLYEEGSVTLAAQRLHVVQPAVSQQLAKLEARLGHKLFHRTPKGMRPTQAGHDAYDIFAPILRNLDHAPQELASRQGEVAGHVSIGVIASVSNNAMSESLISFHRKYPNVTIRATDSYTPDLVDMLRHGKIDIAMINDSLRTFPLPSIEVIQENLAVIFSAKFAQKPPRNVPLSDIQKHKLVLPSPHHGLRVIMDAVARRSGIRFAPALEFDQLTTIQDFVEQTDFITILPQIALHRSLREGRLQSRPTTPVISRRIVCVHMPDRPPTRAAMLLIEELKNKMSGAMSELER